MGTPALRRARLPTYAKPADHLSRPEAWEYYAHAEQPSQADRLWNCTTVQARSGQGHPGVRHNWLQRARAIWQRADRRALRCLFAGRAPAPAADRLRPYRNAVPSAAGRPDQPEATTAAF